MSDHEPRLITDLVAVQQVVRAQQLQQKKRRQQRQYSPEVEVSVDESVNFGDLEDIFTVGPFPSPTTEDCRQAVGAAARHSMRQMMKAGIGEPEAAVRAGLIPPDIDSQ